MGTEVDASLLLFPALPVLPSLGGRPVREGTVPDSVDGGVSDFGGDPEDGDDFGIDDPAYGGGSRAGGCGCSCGAELGHLNEKFRRLEDMICLLLAGAGLARWEETRRVENLRRKI